MNTSTPRTIGEYLKQLRAALRGADKAMIQDALYDAEEHLRAELAARGDGDEAAMLAEVVGSYGAPDEVAEIYRDQEVTVQRAMRTPPPPPRATALGRFFGVVADARTYGALFYMVLSLANGIFYFTWAAAGIGMSLGFSVLIIGIPFVILFVGTIRVLSLVEGRIVEAMLGMRMPRRPVTSHRELPLLKRIGAMFTDARTWSTLLYMLLMLPLGVAYFVIAVVGVTTSLALVLGPLARLLLGSDIQFYFGGQSPLWAYPLISLFGVLLLIVTLHVARGVGRLHAHIARHFLVRSDET
jgi:uncharacterized membrane protein